MQIFVTGGSGFVGGHLIRALVAAGHAVSALSRSPKSAAAVSELGARPVSGELGAVPAEGLRGVDCVIHAAAYVEEWGSREQYWTANVEGTSQLLAAAEAAGVARFIHVGTEAALFAGQALLDIDESAPYPSTQRFLYSETKAEAERRVFLANRPGFTSLSIRPRLVWGPGDTSVLPTVLSRARAGQFAWLDGGRHLTSTCHVDNLVHALLLALTRGEGGRSYFIADEGTHSIREFLDALAANEGVSLGERSVPGALARPLSVIVEGLWTLLRLQGAPPLTRFAVAMMSRPVTVRTDRAKAELGYAPVITVEDGIDAMRR